MKGGELVVVGGRFSVGTEVCSFDQPAVACRLVQPELVDYDFHPLLMLVGNSYCI